MKWTLAVSGFFLAYAASISAQVLNVKVVGRQDNGGSYDYAAVYNNTTVGTTFRVQGATLTLQLPDGRLAVVNCESKFAEHFAGPLANRRSCRVPIAIDIQAEFHGDKAKLLWLASIDGKKKDSETYKILGVFDAPTPTPPPVGAAPGSP